MMNRSIASIAIFALLIAVQPTYAKDGEKELSPEEQYKKIASLGPGVHAIKKNKKGRIISLIVVGQARISTTLGTAKGLELARNKANLDCSAQFVKWLNEESSVYESDEDETIILMEGTEGSDGGLLKEDSKSVEKNSKKMTSLSKGLLRGLQILHKDVDDDSKTLTIVKGWNADTAEGAKKIKADLATDEPETKDSKSKKSKTKESKINKDIKNESVTSEDAEEFLPKAKE